MLDTNIVSLLETRGALSLDASLRSGRTQSASASSRHPSCATVAPRKDPRNFSHRSRPSLGAYRCWHLDVPADAQYGVIRAELEASGKPIGPNDLFIAAHAYALGAVLVTANMGEFARVRALQVENWLD
ncbi:PIN domain-containing protein [Rhizobium sp. CCGE 510]|uniref:PIN domain-containing protein n=1 Tax=Rhizobium sp. CCGE 510 TaxID=1132836 RepID=UPI003204F492